MNLDLLNGAALGLALGLSLLGARWAGTPLTNDRPGAVVTSSAIADARGFGIAPGAYRRIVSLNPVADHLLIRLVEPARLVGTTTYTLNNHPEAWRFSGVVGLPSADQVEPVLLLKPDLVVVSEFADESMCARLREQGVTVFDLGEARGVDTTLAAIRTLGQVLLVQKRAQHLEEGVRRQLRGLKAAAPTHQHVPGLYLTAYGDAFFGGTSGSSYADILRYGGVDDIAEAHGYRGWPAYTPEQLLVMDPPLVVSGAGTRRIVCGHPTLRRIAACTQGQFVELAEGYDSGLGVLHAAQSVFDQVHGGPR